MKQKLHYCSFAMSCIMAFVSCSNGNHDNGDVLFPNVSIQQFVENTTKLSSMLDGYSIIPLETSPECLIGGLSNKIIKSGGKYFIQSVNEILVFDRHGRYERKLSRMGNGDEEYNQLLDYEVVPEYNEIWISTLSGIVRYKLEGFEYCGKIPLSFFANKIKFVGEDKILALTPDDKVFNLCSINGEIFDSYLDKDLANNSQSTVQFINVGNEVVSGLADSNTAVCFDPRNNEFCQKNILPVENENLVTTDINKRFFDTYGYLDFSKKVIQEHVGIISFRKQAKASIVSLRYPGIKTSLVINNGSEIKQYIVWPEDQSVVENDVTSSPDTSFLLSFADCISDDSFIFIMPNDDNEKNPSLLEVRSFK